MSRSCDISNKRTQMSQKRDISEMDEKAVKKQRTSKFPYYCCEKLIRNRQRASEHKKICKLSQSASPTDELNSKLQSAQQMNLMEQFKQLKEDLAEKKETETEIINLLTEQNGSLALFELCKAVPEICRDGAFIQYDPVTRRLYSLPYTRANKKYFNPIISECSLDVTDINLEA